MIESIRKKVPFSFVIVILVIIVFEYFVNLKLVWLDHKPSSTAGIVIYLAVYHLCLFMLLWSMFKSMLSEPGKVPTFWGYFMNDPENRRKKYCMICHIYKPERTHHCRACQRCVLNMDHHCPWINNCIGFYNRKFFILMLIYATLTCILQAIGIVVSIPAIIRQMNRQGQAMTYVSDLVIVIAFVFDIVILVMLVIFLKFHLELILNNTTTIETLPNRPGGGEDPASYNIGRYYNWLQVFGKNYWHWPLPMFFAEEGPAGDGVIWPKRPETAHV